MLGNVEIHTGKRRVSIGPCCMGYVSVFDDIGYKYCLHWYVKCGRPVTLYSLLIEGKIPSTHRFQDMEEPATPETGSTPVFTFTSHGFVHRVWCNIFISFDHCNCNV